MNFLHTLNFQLSKRGQCRDQMTQNQTVLLLFFKGNWSQNNGSFLSLAETSGFSYENCKNVSSTDVRTIFLVKVSKSQNKLMKSSFSPKNERNIARISTLNVRAEILAIFCLFFGKNDDLIILFWDLLTFRGIMLIGDWFSTKIVKLANQIFKVPFFT